ncbi:MAG: hypothetical protein P8I82_02205 [Flavobacteriales bacterium]|nr:hypothetical protein [Flavobacteriales bacterium]
MLEFCKNVLQKVSFDDILFKKELTKSLQWVNEADAESLRTWCLKMYGNKYADIIQQAFETIS